MFGFSKKTQEPQEETIPAPKAEHYVLTEAQQAAYSGMIEDMDGYVKIGDVSHYMLNQQSQYISEYMDGRSASPILVEGLRVKLDDISYHQYRIHYDDVPEFIARVRAWRNRY
ncbi:MAG: hypothetical protein H9W81_07710 [Enterococcus sp.]|nr:hypothetical protein [Enterococcus sp.]